MRFFLFVPIIFISLNLWAGATTPETYSSPRYQNIKYFKFNEYNGIPDGYLDNVSSSSFALNALKLGGQLPIYYLSGSSASATYQYKGNYARTDTKNTFTLEQTISSNVYVSGNVGIGITNPIAPMHVNRSISTDNDVLIIQNTAGWESNQKTSIGYRDILGVVCRMSAWYDGSKSIWAITSQYHSGAYYTPSYITFQVAGDGNAWVLGDMSAQSFTDRTPYPETKQIAYDSVMSMEKKSTGGVNHSKLNTFIQSKKNETVLGRDLSATVSCQNEVIKDLIKRIEKLEMRNK